MKPTLLKRKASRIYLLLVPVLVIIFGFGLGKINYTFYLPVWLINVSLMLLASWFLGLNIINEQNEKKYLAKGAFFLIVPWILVSMFFGLGPPPDTPQGWVATATEQQVRYSMLILAGVSIAFGFSILREELKNNGENYYSLLGFVSIIIAIPLFILDMLFWGFLLTEMFKVLVTTKAGNLPDWFSPFRVLFGVISVVEVALTYLAIIFLVVSMNLVGWLGKTSSKVYGLISFAALLIIVLSAFLPEPFITAGFAVSIPAIPFLIPYFIGVNLLKYAGD